MAPDHYHCHQVYVLQTRLEHITKIVKFFPHKTPIPQASKQDEIIEAAQRLIITLQVDHIALLFNDKNKIATVLQNLTDIFLYKVENIIKRTQSNQPIKPRLKKSLPEETRAAPRVIKHHNAQPTRVTQPQAKKSSNNNLPNVIPETAREKRACV